MICAFPCAKQVSGSINKNLPNTLSSGLIGSFDSGDSHAIDLKFSVDEWYSR